MRIAILAMVFLAAASSALATTARIASLAELVQRAELVVVGRAGERSSYWDGGRIKTRTRFIIEDVWVGSGAHKGSEVEVVTLGGVVGSIGQRVDGVAQLRTGERAVLCLASQDPRAKQAGLFHTVAMAQGAFHIDEIPGRDDPAVRRSVSNLRLVGKSAGDLPTTLSGLKRAVLAAAAAR